MKTIPKLKQSKCNTGEEKKIHFIGKYFSLLGSQHEDMNEYILSYIWGYSKNYN